MKISLRHMAALLCLMGVSGIEARTKRIKKEIIWPTVSYHADQEKITIDARTLSKQETGELFDGRGSRLIGGGLFGRKPIIPVEILLTNKTEAPIIISSINMPGSVLNKKMIIDLIQRRSYWKVALWAVVGGVIGVVTGGVVGAICAYAVVGSPAAATGFMFAGLGESLAIGMAGVIGACVALPVGSYILAKNENEAQSTRRKKVKNRLSAGMLDSEIVIKPGQTYTGYLFTDDYTSLSEHFSVTIA